MPIFEYRCRTCDWRFERIEITGKPDQISCPKCGDSRAERLFSAFAVSSGSSGADRIESGPCPCGAPRRGMCES